jgi:uncharacterized protein (DUF1778 family)
MTRVTIEVTDQERQQLKVLATINNLSLKDFILQKTIGDANKKPSKQLLKSFDDVKKNKNLTKHSNFNKFLKDIKK